MQVYFSVYEQLKTSLSDRARGNDWIKQPAIHMGAACGAGAACAAFSNPLFVVKTRLQTQHLGLKTARASGPLYKGTFDALTRIAREEGVAGLYRCVNIYSISCPELNALASAVQQLCVPSEHGCVQCMAEFCFTEGISKLSLCRHRILAPVLATSVDMMCNDTVFEWVQGCHCFMCQPESAALL